MAVNKIIEVVVENFEGDKVQHTSTMTMDFPPAFVGEIVQNFFNIELSERDWELLNKLHVSGYMYEAFGSGFVKAVVSYQTDGIPEDLRDYQNKL